MTGKRIRGRAGQALRKRRLALHPVCAECAKLGLVTATTVIDHIEPLALGGADVDENTQGLCDEHHALKTAAEDASHAGAANHPLWLRPSAVPLTIVCGPPAGGKSTYVADMAGPGDIVIDLDRITERLTGRPGHQRGTAHLDAAIRVRNAMLGELSRASARRAFFVASAPSHAERHWWSTTLGGVVVVIDPGEQTCMARVVERGTPWMRAAVAAWYRRARSPWSPPEAKQEPRAIRSNGEPEGWA